MSYSAPVVDAVGTVDVVAEAANWKKMTGYCLTDTFIDYYFSTALKQWNGTNYVYPITFEDCKKVCESLQDREVSPCNGFKITTVSGEYDPIDIDPGYCKGTYKTASVIKDGHITACTSSDCGECDPTVMNSWEYWYYEPSGIKDFVPYFIFKDSLNIHNLSISYSYL